MKDKILNNKIEEVMNSAMENLKPFLNSELVIGKEIVSNEMTIIPLTKIMVGFVSGGGEYYSALKEIRRETEYPFSGGVGGGVSLKPIGFLIVKRNSVEFIKIESKDSIEKLIETIPEVANFLSKTFGDDNEEN